MGNVAASGGYWVSTPADFIYAEPSTITGSIGVFGILPSFQGTLQKLGIGADGIKTTPLAGEPDLLQGPVARGQPADPDRGRIRPTAGSSRSSPQSRHKTPADIDKIAQGRVWDGGTAHQIGLVDGFGGIDDAIAKAAQLAKLGDERAVRYLEPPKGFREQFLESLAADSDDSSTLRRRLRRLHRAAACSSSRRRSPRSARSCRGRPSRCAASNARRALPRGAKRTTRACSRWWRNGCPDPPRAEPQTPRRSRPSTGPTSRTAGSASKRSLPSRRRSRGG